MEIAVLKAPLITLRSAASFRPSAFVPMRLFVEPVRIEMPVPFWTAAVPAAFNPM